MKTSTSRQRRFLSSTLRQLVETAITPAQNTVSQLGLLLAIRKMCAFSSSVCTFPMTFGLFGYAGPAVAGRKPVEKTPKIIAIIKSLLEHDTAGDPMTGLRWTRKTPEKIAQLMRQLDIEISANTVARLLRDMRFSLRANRKSIATSSSPDRNRQFEYIASLQKRFKRQCLPILSVDSKKRELIGNFKNNGSKWDLAPVDVNDHDFRSDAVGVALPFGIYDVAANLGAVFVGVSHDTPAFAAHAIAKWWQLEGAIRYPNSRRILLLADGGGSNGCRPRAWKTELQSQLTNRFGLTVTVARYPTGTFKIQSNRASFVLGDFEKLGSRAVDKLSKTSQLHPHHQDKDRTRSLGLPCPQEVQNRTATRW